MIERGQNDGKKWICGPLPVGKGRTIHIDSRTGRGYEKVVPLIERFVKIKSRKIKFPLHSSSDVAQEFYVMAFEAIPFYDETRNANLLTFIENHVRNRAINKIKFHSEQKRIPTYVKTKFFKWRCPNCREMSYSHVQPPSVCKSCGAISDSSGWKRYNIQIQMLPSEPASDEQRSPTEVSNPLFEALSAFSGQSSYDPEEVCQLRSEFSDRLANLDQESRTIVNSLVHGLSVAEIAAKIGSTEKYAYNKAATMAKAGIAKLRTR